MMFISLLLTLFSPLFSPHHSEDHDILSLDVIFTQHLRHFFARFFKSVLIDWKHLVLKTRVSATTNILYS